MISKVFVHDELTLHFRSPAQGFVHFFTLFGRRSVSRNFTLVFFIHVSPLICVIKSLCNQNICITYPRRIQNWVPLFPNTPQNPWNSVAILLSQRPKLDNKTQQMIHLTFNRSQYVITSQRNIFCIPDLSCYRTLKQDISNFA